MKSKRGLIITIVILAVLCLALAGGIIYLQNTQQADDNQTLEPTVNASENFIKQNFTDKIILDMESAIIAVSDYFNLTNTDMSFRPQSESSMRGDIFLRMAQYYNDIPVWGRSVVVLVGENGVSPELSGNYIDFSDISVTPILSEGDVFAIVRELYGENIRATNLGLTIYSLGVDPVLCYKIDSFAKTLLICANSGELIASRNNVHDMRSTQFSNSIGQSWDVNDDDCPVGYDDWVVSRAGWASHAGFNYYDLPFFEHNGELIKYCQEKRIVVYSLGFEDVTRYFSGTTDEERSELWQEFASNFLIGRSVLDEAVRFQDNSSSAVDAFGNIIVVYNFFAEHLNWTQIDNNPDSLLAVFVDVFSGRENALYSAYPSEHVHFIVFEAVREGVPQFSINLDVVAHEFVHGVSRETWGGCSGGSDYSEASAIFEALADIFGEIIEHYRTEHNDWKMAGFIRDFYDGRGIEFNSGKCSNHTIAGCAHCNSLVISWIAREIEHSFPLADREQLINYAQLWHGVQKTLSPTSDFQCFANSTVRYAHRMLNNGQITDIQFQAIQNAFKQNGIEPNLVLGDIGSGAVVGTLELNWKVEPTLEYERIWYCPDCGFSTWCALLIDENTGEITGSHLGHGISSQTFLYDEALGLFGEHWQYAGDGELAFFAEDEFLLKFPRKRDRVNLFHGIDSTQVTVTIEPWGNIYDTSEALTGASAVAFGTDFVTEFIFDDGEQEIVRRYNNIIAVQQGESWGIIDKNGNTVVPFVFEHAITIDNYTAFAKYDGRYGILYVGERPISTEPEQESQDVSDNREEYSPNLREQERHSQHELESLIIGEWENSWDEIRTFQNGGLFGIREGWESASGEYTISSDNTLHIVMFIHGWEDEETFTWTDNAGNVGRWEWHISQNHLNLGGEVFIRTN